MNPTDRRHSRKISRDFKGKIELMDKIPLRDLEGMLSEFYDEGINTFLRTEKLRHPELTEKEILVKMIELSEKLKGKKHKR